MRSITDIKREITEEFMKNETAAKLYGFEVGASFGSVFSVVSVESVLMYVFAVCAWSIERLMTEHRSDVESMIDSMKPHRPKWYRDKVLLFMAGKSLDGNSDEYDLTGMSESEIEMLRVVKHAVAVESEDASVLTIKVAGEVGGERQPLSEDDERQLRAYISEIKDAGVRVELVNKGADRFYCEVDIYYDALQDSDEVATACKAKIKDYIENLPFNGEYTNMALVDSLQGVEGVKVAELKTSAVILSEESRLTAIDARATASAGYFKEGRITINMKEYDTREI